MNSIDVLKEITKIKKRTWHSNKSILCSKQFTKNSSKKGKEPWNNGKKMSDEFKKKCSKSHRGKKLSEEHKENVRQSLLNYWEKKKNE